MPISRAEKEAVIQQLNEKFENYSVAVVTDYQGLNVAEATDLRRRLREAGCEYKVAKKTLIGLVVQNRGLEELKSSMDGSIGIAFSNDPVAPAKVIAEFIRETKKMDIKAGVLDGQVIDVAAVKALADLPSREVLLAKVVGGMQAPLYGFAGVLQGTLRSFVYALDAVRQQKAGEAS